MADSIKDQISSIVNEVKLKDKTIDDQDQNSPQVIEKAETRRIVDQDGVEHYEIVKLINEGGMSEIYKAHDLTNNRDVVLKVLNMETFKEDKMPQFFIDAFDKESDVLASLHHPNIAPVLDKGTTNIDGVEIPYYVMEDYSEEKGYQDLATILEKDGALDEEKLASLADQVGSAIDYASSVSVKFEKEAPERYSDILEVINRDIKVANIIWSENDKKWIVIDYGLASTEDNEEFTIGTPSSMSPEHTQEGAKMDRRTDLFSLGIVLYTSLTNENPFSRPEDSIQTIMARIRTEDYKKVPLRRLGAKAIYENFFDKALAKNPDDRFQTGKEMSHAFRENLHSAQAYKEMMSDLDSKTRVQKQS